MASYELSSTLARFLDKHLCFPLLEFLQDKGVYNEEDIMRAKIALLQNTNMVDFAMDIHKELYQTDEVPATMMERRTEVVNRLRSLQKAVDPIIGCLSNSNVIRNFRHDRAFNLQFLKEEFDIGPEQIEALYQFAKFQFDCGNYSMASELLQAYKPLCTTSERNMSVQWGKLAADTLTQNYEAATEALLRLRESLDNQSFATPLMQLQQRTWLMHWSLHVFWNTENGKNALIDLFLQPAYMSAITINAQHLLRYLAAAVVVNRKRRNVLRELIKVIQQESYEYSDPITQFLECLFVHYDFDGAQQKLIECESVIEHDYFLTAIKSEFLESARLFIFETYCRIHQCINIDMLSERLNMDKEAAEKWIANLILSARLNAKIDSKAGTVVMGMQSSSMQESLAEKAKQLSVRTFTLANAVVGAPATKA
ncbi:hypothetical protein OEZ86_000524 [Tetradesmus obliquus]|uniref:Eukaryotic translation initiation factor 3 subunit E n=1 Tax=Tetradesmus obliquus TaxID=3088 RepID=A0A383VVJ9_TETOB|nr:hypothetical protein OEZ86_000524 [Tetradesmus obliquus]|eukprot:jgi/Sobl393_1/8556/SZX69515.1